jgi:hypothetical protein
MRKIFNYSFLVVFLISGITFIYLMTNLSETSNGQILYLLALTIISFVFYIMTEKEASEKTQIRGFVTLWLLAGAVILILFMSSCSRYVSVQDAANGRARCGQSLK